MRDKTTGIVLAAGIILFVLTVAMTNGFQGSNTWSSDCTTVNDATPTASDDISRAFLPGCDWIDQDDSGVYVAVETTDGAAEWVDLTDRGPEAATFVVCASNALDTNRCDYNADGTNDETEINAALAALPAAGGLVWLSDGTFTIGEPSPSLGAVVMKLGDGEHVVGSGIDSTIVQFAASRGIGGDRYLFGQSPTSPDPYGVSNWSIQHMTLVAQDATDHGIRAKGTENWYLGNLRIRHTGNEVSADEGIQCSGADGDSVRRGMISNVTIEDFGTYNIEFARDCSDISVWNMVLLDSGGKNLNFGNLGCTGALFDGVLCVDSTNTIDPRNIRLYNLVATGAATDNVGIERGLDIQFINPNLGSATNYGINGNAGFGSRIQVHGGAIYGNSLAGLAIDGSEWLVDGVQIYNNGQNTGATDNNRAGLRVQGTDHKIINTHVFDDQGVPTQTYAIRLNGAANAATRTFVFNNWFEAGTLDDVSDGGVQNRFMFNRDFQHDVRIYEPWSDGGNYIALEAPTLTGGEGTFTISLDIPAAGCGAFDNGGVLTLTGTSLICDDDDSAVGGSGYATIQNEGVGLTQRTTVNCIGSTITCADNGATLVTDVTFDSDVNALASISGTGVIARTGVGSLSTRTITGTAGEIDVSEGGGVAGNPTISIAAALDLGGNTSVELPNGAGGTTVNAAGEITIDTTSGTVNFFDGATELVLNPELTVGISLENPVDTDDMVLGFKFDGAATLTEICYLSVSGTNWVGQIQEADNNGGTPTDTAASDTTAAAGTETCVTVFSNATFDAGDRLFLKTTSISGTPTWINASVKFRYDP